jgi:prepilin-type processing-associated H-X9-DG protein
MRFLASLSIVLVVASAAFAQPLADRVPADAYLYVGWRGTNDPGPGYAGSKTEALAKESSVMKVFDDTLPALEKVLEAKEPQSAAMLHTATLIARVAVKWPTAFYVSPPSAGGKDHRLAFLVKAGADRETLMAELQELIGENAPKSRTPTRAVAAGDLVAVLFNYAPEENPLPDPAGAALAGSEAFKQAAAANEKDATYFFYLDADRVVGLIEKEIKPGSRDEAEQRKVLKLIDELGLRGVRTVSLSAGLSGRDWHTSSFVATSGPRKGVLALVEGKPFNADLLKRVPASANSVAAYRFDGAKLVAEIRRAATATDPEWGQTVDQALGAASAAIGKNFEDGILAPMGDEWVMYSAKEIAGTGILGTVVINKLDDPAKAKQGLASLGIFMTNTATTFGRGAGIGVKLQTIKSGDLTVSYLGIPVVAPAWAIKDGNLYFGLYPQTVIAAAQYAGPSITENKLFNETIAHLEQTKPVAMKFTDTAVTIDDGYNFYQVLLRTYLGFADIFGAPSPEPLLPPLSAFMKHAEPVGSVAWADDAGLHSRSTGPFPGAELLANGSILSLYTQNAPLMAAVMMPALNRSREAANRIKSASNLRIMGQAAFMFSNEDVRTGKFPDDFEDMLRTQDITADIFVNPRTETELPPVPAGKTQAEALGDWVNDKSDYVWVGKGKTNAAAADTILAYEKPDGLEDGINVLFADGHVDFISFDSLEEVFKASKLTPPKLEPGQTGNMGSTTQGVGKDTMGAP